jgi:hypothetical protein
MSVSEWPSSPLDAAQRAFDLLVEPPSHVGFDGRGFAGLPDEILPLDDLRDLLLSPDASFELRDAVWRELVVRARRDGPAWVVAAVGMAMPGLRRVAGMLAAGWRGDTDDLDSELIVGFVARLKTIDVDTRRVCGRLIDAGVRAARKARDADSDAHLIHSEVTGPIAGAAGELSTEVEVLAVGLFEGGAQSMHFLTVLLLEPVDLAGEGEDDAVGRVRALRRAGLVRGDARCGGAGLGVRRGRHARRRLRGRRLGT